MYDVAEIQSSFPTMWPEGNPHQRALHPAASPRLKHTSYSTAIGLPETNYISERSIPHAHQR